MCADSSDGSNSNSKSNTDFEDSSLNDASSNNSSNVFSIKQPSLKQRFLFAIVKGELGSVENAGVVVSLKEFKAYFSDIKTDYVNSFLPAATFEPGQSSVTHTKYLFRVRKGVYLVHAEAIAEFVAGLAQYCD